MRRIITALLGSFAGLLCFVAAYLDNKILVAQDPYGLTVVGILATLGLITLTSSVYFTGTQMGDESG